MVEFLLGAALWLGNAQVTSPADDVLASESNLEDPPAPGADGDKEGDDEDAAKPDEVGSTPGTINVPEAPPAEASDDQGEAHPLWMEVYSEGARAPEEHDNISGFSDVKVGRRINLPLPIDFYAKARLARDQGDFYWNNFALAGAGVRISLLKPVNLSLFAQALTGSYLRVRPGAVDMQAMQQRIDLNRAAIASVQGKYADFVNAMFNNPALDTSLSRGRIGQIWDSLANVGFKNYNSLLALDTKLDTLQAAKDSLRQNMDSLARVPAGQVIQYQVGLTFEYAWGAPADDPSGPWFSFPFRFWGDVYSDCIFQADRKHVLARKDSGDVYSDLTLRTNNLIYYGNPDVGVLLMDGRAGSVAAYVTAYVWYDTRGDWWNNMAMGGPGLRWQPIPALDFAVTGEYLWGRYYGRERTADPNPYPRRFQDLRVGANFWYGLGF